MTLLWQIASFHFTFLTVLLHLSSMDKELFFVNKFSTLLTMLLKKLIWLHIGQKMVSLIPLLIYKILLIIQLIHLLYKMHVNGYINIALTLVGYKPPVKSKIILWEDLQILLLSSKINVSQLLVQVYKNVLIYY